MVTLALILLMLVSTILAIVMAFGVGDDHE